MAASSGFPIPARDSGGPDIAGLALPCPALGIEVVLKRIGNQQRVVTRGRHFFKGSAPALAHASYRRKHDDPILSTRISSSSPGPHCLITDEGIRIPFELPIDISLIFKCALFYSATAGCKSQTHSTIICAIKSDFSGFSDGRPTISLWDGSARKPFSASSGV